MFAVIGNTPTGVGKTPSRSPHRCRHQKHPHGRGEDSSRGNPAGGCPETPQRAWGRPPMVAANAASYGNTPTGVGKTCPARTLARYRRKHPHGRGEDDIHSEKLDGDEETPPRAWGRLSMAFGTQEIPRNTPTGVGKTFNKAFPDAVIRKHPHGRGEDCLTMRPCSAHRETPPRAWGRLNRKRQQPKSSRNTPTGVGKTTQQFKARVQIWKHPHGRGEDASSSTRSA